MSVVLYAVCNRWKGKGYTMYGLMSLNRTVVLGLCTKNLHPKTPKPKKTTKT